MKKYGLILALALAPFFLISQASVTVYETFEEFEKAWLSENDDKVVINFWATWCVPCVEELPYFLEWREKNAESGIKLILVSLDRGKDVDRRVKPFLKKKGIEFETYLLADGRASSWIDKVDPSWSGAIPATVFRGGGKKQFAEKSYYSTKELSDEITDFFK